MILGYHQPPNGLEEAFELLKMVVLWTKTDFETPGVVVGRTVAACGTIVDGAWSTGASTGRMTARKDEYTFSNVCFIL
ncbi:hypothetical protein C1H46_045011 [Malus baccata]|uniref:Uncharacterized protein n=1 Tax=Malus baccata TaxID=106549 RepID=A0A540K5E7_MALBA|nr:hypothetical protein C1H46_045011 [Malus baccata]